MADSQKTNGGNTVQKPMASEQTRGQSASNATQKPQAPTPPPSKPKQ